MPLKMEVMPLQFSATNVLTAAARPTSAVPIRTGVAINVVISAPLKITPSDNEASADADDHLKKRV